jgi:hypothetical protein
MLFVRLGIQERKGVANWIHRFSEKRESQLASRRSSVFKEQRHKQLYNKLWKRTEENLKIGRWEPAISQELHLNQRKAK